MILEVEVVVCHLGGEAAPDLLPSPDKIKWEGGESGCAVLHALNSASHYTRTRLQRAIKGK